MKYIYDIILNFNEKFYEFYEWNDSDNVDYIKRIPIIKVSDTVIRDLKVNKIEIDTDFLNSICDKCEIYMNNGIGKIEYACLFCGNESIIGIEFNYKGVSIYKSDLMIDEALDIIDYTKKMKFTKLEYKILDHDKVVFTTRKESSMINFIRRELKEIFMSNNIDKLKYLYYECFNKIDENISKMTIELEKYMIESPTKLFELLMLSYSNR